MKLLIKHVLKHVALFSIFSLFINCDDNWLDIDSSEGCGFYSYINIAQSCECLEDTEENCSIDYYQLDKAEFNRISILFNESEQSCIEISGADFVGKPFSGFAKRPFVDYCHKWFGN
jgi:hypothetical protein